MAQYDNYYRYVNPYEVDFASQFTGVRNFISGLKEKLTDEQDETWLDLVAHFGAAALGHNHPQILSSLQSYLSSNAVTIQSFGINPVQGHLAKRLLAASPIENGRVVFGTTGAEAIEGAMKIALTSTGRTHCIGIQGGFHGLTLSVLKTMKGTIWAAPLSKLDAPDTLPLEDTGCWQLMLEQTRPAAIIMELIQGIGGGYCWDRQALANLQKLCRTNGTLLIVDEVQTGLGRCGDWYVSNQYEQFEPDMIVISKGLSGGIVPLSAILVKAEHHDALFGQAGCARIHGSTFAGNNMAMHNAMTVLDIIESEDLIKSAKHVGTWLFSRLNCLKQKYPIIKAINGQGLLICIEFTSDDPNTAIWVLQNFSENNILVNLASHRANTLKITPALNVSKDALEDFLAVFEAILQHNYEQEEDDLA